jgi:hypothetical protein
VVLKSSRRGNVPPFIVMDILRLANEHAARGANIVHLEVGRPVRRRARLPPPRRRCGATLSATPRLSAFPVCGGGLPATIGKSMASTFRPNGSS